MAQWLSWLERRPVTAEVTGSSPVWVVHKWTTVERLLCILCINYGILAQLGEHLPYKQRVTGSSPVGPILSIIYQKKSIMVIWANSRVAKGDRL